MLYRDPILLMEVEWKPLISECEPVWGMLGETSSSHDDDQHSCCLSCSGGFEISLFHACL